MCALFRVQIPKTSKFRFTHKVHIVGLQPVEVEEMQKITLCWPSAYFYGVYADSRRRLFRGRYGGSTPKISRIRIKTQIIKSRKKSCASIITEGIPLMLHVHLAVQLAQEIVGQSHTWFLVARG